MLSHCHPVPPGIFPKVDPDAGLDGTPGELARCARELGFDRAVAVAPDLTTDDPGYGVEGDPNAWLAAEVARPECRDTLIPFMRLRPHVDLPGSVAEMERYAAAGFSGVKIHPEIQRIDLRRVDLDDFFGAAARLGLPVLTHTGVLRGGFPLVACEPMLFERYAAAHPDLALVMAHAGGAPFFRQVLALMQSYPNVYADLTGTLTPGSMWHIPPAELYLARDVGLRGRLIYGADWPFGGEAHVRADLAAIDRLELDEEEKGLILGGTLARLLRLEK
jgi:predicted TIM-barrel fold metal-dependent hydrolase